VAANVVKSFSLNTHHDKALIARLDKLGRGELSKVVRDALNEYFSLHNGGVTLADIYTRLGTIERKLSNGGAVGEVQADHVDDDDGDELDASILGSF